MKKIKKPDFALYLLAYIVFYPFLKIFFRLTVDRENYRAPRGAFIALSNHSSFMDFLLVMLAIYPRRLNAVAAQKFFLFRPLNWLLPKMGCIPKNLFDPDIRSVRGMLEVLARGGGVLMFPEGRCSTDGVYAGIHEATGKLIKKLGVPVVASHIEGAFVCMPFWRKGFRMGRVRVTLSNLLSEPQIESMSADEINAYIDEALSGQALKKPPLSPSLFRAKNLSDGLADILYLCPKCGREFTLEAKGNEIMCAACGNCVEVGRGLRFTARGDGVAPESIAEWQKAQAEHELRGFKSVEISVYVRMPALPDPGLRHCGAGTLRLDREGWRFSGELNGRAEELFFPLKTVPAVPFDANDDFQIYAHGSFYVFTPAENARACAKYALLGECVYRRYAQPMQMTAGLSLNEISRCP